MKKLHALVLGATGATGRELVKLLLEDSKFEKVSIFLRNIPEIRNDKLEIHKIDFNKINEYRNLINGDILFSALGTTKKEAGGKKQQYLVDYIYQYNFAKIASENGVKNYSLVSSAGASEKSIFFYLKIKGALEKAVKKLKFKKIDIFQPPMLIRQPDLVRASEKSGIKFLNSLNKIGLLKSQKPLNVKNLAVKMVRFAMLKNQFGVTTYQSKDLFK